MSIQRLSNAGQSGFRYKSLIAGITPVASVPVIGEATAVTFSTASVTFTAPGAYAGSTYTATSSPGGLTGTSASSPITVSGLSENTAYTFTVTATNATGTSSPSAASNSITTPVAFAPDSGYDSLATVSISSNTSSITFTGIPSGYKHLQIRGLVRGNTASTLDAVKMTFNSDTSGSNYVTLHQIYGSGASAAAQASTGNGWIYQSYLAGNNAGANMFGSYITDILDYSSVNKNKTTRTLAGTDQNGSGYVTFGSGLWMNSSTPITRIDLEVEGSTFRQYSQLALYGVK
jgi:hypothetical protein